MTEVAFHFGASDRLAYTCRLLRKATATGARLQVRSSTDMLAALDNALWRIQDTAFISHCTLQAPDTVQSRSAVLLQPALSTVQAQTTILVNLGDDVPQGFEQFARVIEVVSIDEGERNLARRRWKHYTECGYTITRHDLASKAE
ncbi:MAG: DNA polymerase III subunit chi [Rhodoferax sp.]|nr:DNA polymerase III subunit chi [Rhodoferax sp.]